MFQIGTSNGCRDESTKVIRRPFPGVTDVQGLASRLLEVALLRVAKFVWAGESQGRVASLPAALVPHLAERREKAAMVVEAGLVDTVALLAWTAASLEDGE